MMESWSRRAAIESLVAGFALAALPLSAASPVGIPLQPMRLTRLLARELRDGKRIVIERSWLVGFAAVGNGFSLTGHQIDVSVDAPEEIAAIAEIERNRPTDGMFPILLGADGLIEAAGKMERPQDVAAAVEKAQEMIANAAMTGAERHQAGYYLAQIQNAGGDLLESLPRDLFFPRGTSVHETRTVDLPDGSRGEFEFTYSAEADPVSGWLDHAERRITTRLAATERNSIERWSMHTA